MKNLILIALAAAVMPDIFDIDVGGKYYASIHRANGKSCGVCGEAHNGCDYPGQILGCRYTYLTTGVMPNGTPWYAENWFFKKKYARPKK